MFCEIDLKDKVKYGLYNFGECSEAAKGSLRYILSDISGIKKYYVRLGFHLQEFKSCMYYRDFGYSSFEEFCDANLSLDKGAISRCISVWQNSNCFETLRDCLSAMYFNFISVSFVVYVINLGLLDGIIFLLSFWLFFTK